MKQVIMTLVLTGLLSLNASAGSLNTGDVSSKAKWVAHLDMASFRSTRTWELLKLTAKPEHIKNQMYMLEQILGFDPITGLTGVTLYGNSFAQGNGVVVARGNFPVAYLCYEVFAAGTFRG